jgi:hypothetical protein
MQRHETVVARSLQRQPNGARAWTPARRSSDGWNFAPEHRRTPFWLAPGFTERRRGLAKQRRSRRPCGDRIVEAAAKPSCIASAAAAVSRRRDGRGKPCAVAGLRAKRAKACSKRCSRWAGVVAPPARLAAKPLTEHKEMRIRRRISRDHGRKQANPIRIAQTGEFVAEERRCCLDARCRGFAQSPTLDTATKTRCSRFLSLNVPATALHLVP